MRRRSKTALVVLLAFALFAAALAAFSIYLLDPQRLFARAEGRSETVEKEDFAGEDRINIALLGFDRSAERDKTFTIYRPDTIMIASLELEKGTVSLVNIPRDSYVAIAGGGGYDKINHAYMHGYYRPGADDPHQSGIETTLQTIEDFLGGVPAHYYVALDMDAVVEIVDRLGGVDYEVEYPVRADFGRGELLLEEGFQRLDGRSFLTYIRDRSVGGDIGRSRRQQQVLIAAFSQLKNKGSLSSLPALYRSLQDNLETNLSPAQVASLAMFGTRVEPEQIRTYVFPGSIQFAPQGEIDVSYVVIDEEARVELIREVFGAAVEQRAQIVLPGRRRDA